MRISDWSSDVCSSDLLAGCVSRGEKPPAISYDAPPAAAVQTPPPVAPVEVVAIPQPLPLPGQLKPVDGRPAAPEAGDPRERVGAANAAARIEPVRDGFINAMQLYPWTDGALSQRSEERRGRKEGVRTGRHRWSPYN